MLYRKEVAESLGVEGKTLRAEKTDSEGQFIWTFILGQMFNIVPKVESTWETTKKIKKT